MKKLFLLSALLFASASSWAQGVRYSYDAAGNRVKRELVVIVKPFLSPQQNNSYTDDLSDDYRVKISSSSDGTIRVEVIGSRGPLNGNITVYSLSGMQILSSQIENSSAVVSLAGQANGVYVLNININGHQTSWKVAKQ